MTEARKCGLRPSGFPTIPLGPRPCEFAVGGVVKARKTWRAAPRNHGRWSPASASLIACAPSGYERFFGSFALLCVGIIELPLQRKGMAWLSLPARAVVY